MHRTTSVREYSRLSWSVRKKGFLVDNLIQVAQFSILPSGLRGREV